LPTQTSTRSPLRRVHDVQPRATPVLLHRREGRFHHGAAPGLVDEGRDLRVARRGRRGQRVLGATATKVTPMIVSARV